MQIADGRTSEEVAHAVGVSGPVGARWFRHAGGMPSIELYPPTGRYLRFTEREDIAILRAEGLGCARDRRPHRAIAVDGIARDQTQRRHRGGKLEYRALLPSGKADLAAATEACEARRERSGREYVQDRLSWNIRAEDGSVVAGPDVEWTGRNKRRRADRRWATAWSPEPISNRLELDFPDDPAMRISHEAIYIEGRGGLGRELVACLRTGRALRKPRSRARQRKIGFITEEVALEARPDEVDTARTGTLGGRPRAPRGAV